MLGELDMAVQPIDPDPSAPTAPVRPLYLQLLGDLRICNDDGEDVTPRGRKLRGMIAYLALADHRTVSRERLVGLLWGDRGEEQARASLRQALAELRQATPEVAAAIVTNRQSVAITGKHLSCDVDVIAQALAAGDAIQLLPLLARISGPLLADLEGLDRAFDDWLRAERGRHQDVLVAGVSKLATEAAADPERIDMARSLVAALQRLDPGSEEAGRLGMRLDQRVGDLASLHRRFRQLSERLRRDFDAEPSSATRRLFRELTSVAPVPAGPPVSPPPSSPRTSSPSAATAKGDGSHRGGWEPPIVVVTPLAAITGDPETALLARICSEDIETALGRFGGLRILSIGTPTAERLEALCSGAVASYTLAGSVRSGARGLRVNLRLNEIDSGRVAWSRQLDIYPTDLAGAIDDVVDRVAGAVLPVVERELRSPERLAAPHDPAAYAIYLRARAMLIAADTLARAREATELLEAVVARAPALTDAQLYLVRLYNTDFNQLTAGHDHAPLRARALELGLSAAARDPENSHVHTRLGWCYLRSGDWDRAHDRFTTAVELNPHYADRLNEAGFGMAHLGDLVAADRLIQRAFVLNPFPLPEYFSDVAVVKMLGRSHDHAEELFASSTDRSLHYLAVRAANLALAGQIEAAARLLAELHKAFKAIWSREPTPTDDDLLRWIDLCLPLRMAEHRQMLHDGLSRAGLATVG